MSSLSIRRAVLDAPGSLPQSSTFIPMIFVGLLFAFHAAAFALPGRAYFHLAAIGDSTEPVGPNVLLHPAYVLCLAFLIYASIQARRLHRRNAGIDLVRLGLGIWFVAATLGAIANYDRDQVVLTYLMVFGAGAVVYLTLSTVEVSDRLIDAAFLGLAAGALFPLLAGIREYVAEWGVPDANILMNATLDVVRMQGYEAATFGNRGNTAAFLVILGPPLLSLVLDRSRHWALRVVYAALLLPVLVNLLMIQVRAAFIVMVVAMGLVWRFKSGSRTAYLVFFAGVALLVFTVLETTPEVGDFLTQRFEPVLTLQTARDDSLMGRQDAMQEGMRIAKANWELGVGPGGALTVHTQTSAHQFLIQQAMETGVLGLVGSLLMTGSILLSILMVAARGAKDQLNRVRFVLLIGPAAYLLYGVIANLTLNIGYVNTWSVIVAALLGLYRSAAAVPLRQQQTVIARSSAVAPIAALGN